MNKRTVTRLILLTTFARESMTQSTPTTSQLDQERQRIKPEHKQMFDPNNPASKARRGAMPNSVDIGRETCRVSRERGQMFGPSNSVIRDIADMFPSVPAPERAGINIEALARQYKQEAQAHRMDDLMTLASFTMPAESLKRIANQVNRMEASAVLRDFKNNSLKDATLVIKELGGQGGNALVNLNAFTKYKAKAVPTMVLAKATATDQMDNEGYILLDNFVTVTGDVSSDCILDEVVHRAPQFEVVASRYLRQIRGNQ